MQKHPSTTTKATVTKTQITSLLTILEGVPDPRVTATVDHALPDILTIALCTILCGGESFYDMEEFCQVRLDWLKTFLRLRRGAPTHDTYNRVFQALDPEEFGDCLSRWTQAVRTVLDGKTLRRALKKGEDARVIVNAWATESGLLLGQRKVRNKSNEITVVPELLRALELAGCIVTADALHCQKHIAREIVEADADYVLALKGNQGTAYAEVKVFLDDAIARKETHLVTLETLDKEYGRFEERCYWQSGKLEWFADRKEWEGLQSVGMVQARRTVGGKEAMQRRYYLSSLKADVEKFAKAVRGHWGVENGLHWVLDVVFGEDQARARSGHAPENLAATRRLAVSLLRRDKTCRRSIKGKLLRAAIDPDYLKRILKT